MATQVRSEDLSQPLIRRKSVSARNDARMKTEVDCGEFGRFVTDEPVPQGGTGEGPSPLQVVLGALCGCEAVTFRRTATELGFDYSGIEFEGAFTIDIRGRMGVAGVRPHFQTVRVQATVQTDESEDRLRRVVEETEGRCPVYNLIRDSGAVYALDEEALQAVVTADTPDIVKVFNLIKTLHHLIAEKGAHQPFLIPIGERAERIAELFQDRQISTEQALQELSGLVQETEEAQQPIIVVEPSA